MDNERKLDIEKPFFFRYQRRELKDSLKTEISVDNLEDLLFTFLKDNIFEYCNCKDILPSDISVEYYGFDSRVFSHLHIVSSKEYGVIGFAYKEAHGKLATVGF